MEKDISEGKPIDASRYDKLKEVIAKGDKAVPMRDPSSGTVLPVKTSRANKMLMAQINHVYFGDNGEDASLPYLDNVSLILDLFQ